MARRVIAIAVVIMLFPLGCTSPTAAPSRPSSPPAKLSISPADGAEKVAPDSPVEVRQTAGRLTRVTVSGPEGHEATGTTSQDGRSWRTKWSLRPKTRYTVTAEGTGPDGGKVTATARFKTLKPKRSLTSAMSPLPQETVGVGMPIQLLLSDGVGSKKHKAAIERAIEIKMSEPVEGAWNWVTDKEVQFRPKEYWPTGEKVKVTAHLSGVRAGGGRWGVSDRTTEFTVGDRHITKVSAKSHQAKVTKNGKTVRKIPVSLGKRGTESFSGTMIAQEKNASIIMDSATTGRPGEYRIRTRWNVRMTYSGTFFHSAPWSTGAQGDRNVSHGCLNASPSNAKWFFDFTRRGDIIEVSGTSKKVPFGSGPTPWARSWEKWLEGSALGKPVKPATD